MPCFCATPATLGRGGRVLPSAAVSRLRSGRRAVALRIMVLPSATVSVYGSPVSRSTSSDMRSKIPS